MEFIDYLRFGFALVFVIGLIGGMAVVARRFGFGFPSGPGIGKQRRLRVVEALPLDGRRRLVLIRRDETEYLVLLGATSETLVDGPMANTAAAAPADSPARSAGKAPPLLPPTAGSG